MELLPSPKRYSYSLWKTDEPFIVDIYSTADGNVVKCDVYQSEVYDNRIIQFVTFHPKIKGW